MDAKRTQTILVQVGRIGMLRTRISIVAFCCLLGSCSLVSTVYQNAPEMMRWWLDGYFDFTKEQKTVLTPALHQVHEWHRQQQLPQLIIQLKTVHQAVSQDSMASAQACQTVDAIKSQFYQLQTAFIPTIIQIAPSLSDRQLDYLKSKLDKRAQKWKSEWWQESKDAQIEARLEKFVDYAEKVYGKLNRQQITLIEQQLSLHPTRPELTYAEILRRNQDVETILRALRDSSLNESQQQTLIADGFARLQHSPNEAYQRYVSQATLDTCDTISKLHASTSDQQKKHASDWFEKYIRQFSALSKSANQISASTMATSYLMQSK